MRGAAHPLTALLAATLLAGCGMTGGTAPAATPATSQTQEGVRPTPRDGEAAPRPQTQEGVRPTPRDGEAAPRPQTPPDDDPARLVGLVADGVTARLGQPAMVRRDGTAQIWYYRAVAEGGTACVLHIFLYPDGNTPRVSHVETRAGLDPLIGEGSRACLRAVLAGRTTS